MNNIRAAAQLAQVERVDGTGLARVVRVPAHKTINSVYLRRAGSGFDAECKRRTPLGELMCPAYEHGLVCYHAQAAVEVAAAARGYKVVGWTKTEKAATRLLNLKQYRGCKISRLSPRGGGKAKWFLWR